MLKLKFSSNRLALWAFLTMFVLVQQATHATARQIDLKHNGLAVNAKMVMADGKKLSDGVILITHGTLAHSRMEIITTMQSLLAERGWNSLAINLSLGLDNRKGMFDCKVAITDMNTGALDEIGLWLNWLKTKGAKNIVLMGHSRGGNQTAWFGAERFDPAISKLVLLAPSTWTKESARATYLSRFGFTADKMLGIATKLVAAGKGNERLKKTGVVYCENAVSTAAAFVSYHKPDQRFHTPNLLAKQKVPVLVVAGEKDNVVKGLIEAVKPLQKPGKTLLKVVEDADHFFLDFAAEDAADAIDAFLRNKGN